MFFQRIHRGNKARVFWLDKADFNHQEHAGVQVTPAKTFGKGRALFAPGLTQDTRLHHGCMVLPVRGALGLFEHHSNFAQPVARGPAHQRRRGVYAGSGAQLPHASVRFIVSAHRLLAHLFEPFELGQPGAVQQPVVVKSLGCTQYHIAVNIMLKMLLRLVANADRAHAALA